MISYNSLSYYQQIAYIFQNVQLIVTSIGLASNATTFVVFSRKRLRTYSFSFYIRVMTVCEIFAFLHGLRHWVAFIDESDLNLVASFFCTINEYQPYVAATISCWMLTSISIDRLITILYPHRFKILKKRNFQIMILVIVALYSLGVFIEMPLSYKIVTFTFNVTNSTQQVIRMCTVDAYMGQVISWINIANLVGINVIFNSVVNTLMVVLLFRSRRRVDRRSEQFKNTERRDRKFAINSIGLTVVSTLGKLPFSILLVAINYLNLSYDQIQMLFNITVSIVNADGAATFFVNMYANSMFYREFWSMLGIMHGENSATNNSKNSNNRLRLSKSKSNTQSKF